MECGHSIVEGKHFCSEACARQIAFEQQALSEVLSKNRFGYKLLPPLVGCMGTLFVLMGLSSFITGRFRNVDAMAILAGIIFLGFAYYIQRWLRANA